MGYVPTSLLTYDIAYQDEAFDRSFNDIWVATDHADSPIRSYNMAGTLTYACDLVEYVKGIAYSYEFDNHFIWVSNPSNDMIYKIALTTTGVGDEGGPAVEALAVSTSSNPFSASVTFTATGLTGEATIEIYDMMGRAVTESTFSGSFTWDGRASTGEEVPSGVYLTKVSDPSGQSAFLTVSRL